ncbi:MAG TPA: thiolase family protein [Bdellovibrionota bacterium]|jgi:acetyl-CoA acyltransferase|nr:thiolase family protein [Bdellovibrionota bacterium]
MDASSKSTNSQNRLQGAYLVNGVRTPFAKAGGQLKDLSGVELGRFALSELIARSGLSVAEIGKLVDEVIIGNTGTPSDAANISRVVALNAGLPEPVSAYTVHRNCASAMESVAQAALKVDSGHYDVVFAGGTESMSQMPLIYNQVAVNFFDQMSRAKSTAQKLSLLAKMPIGAFLKPRIAIVEGLTDPFCGINMGGTAEVLAKEFKISREEQDQFALASHQKAVSAAERGIYTGEIAPLPIPPKYKETLAVDAGPRKGQSLEALAKLKPYFDRKHGTVTVGNACPITDGAAMALIANEAGLKKLGGAQPIAKIIGYAFAGLDPKRMGLGPVYATHKALKQTGLRLSDMGVIEINEAFAAQVIACLMAFDSEKYCQEHFGSSRMGLVDLENLNPNGGAIAIGHPVGATGTRIILTAALEMKRRNVQYALATLCIGGGQGGAVILENID